jgi:hypothetical protein
MRRCVSTIGACIHTYTAHYARLSFQYLMRCHQRGWHRSWWVACKKMGGDQLYGRPDAVNRNAKVLGSRLGDELIVYHFCTFGCHVRDVPRSPLTVISCQEMYDLASVLRLLGSAHSSLKLWGKLNDKESIQPPRYTGRGIVILTWQPQHNLGQTRLV